MQRSRFPGFKVSLFARIANYVTEIPNICGPKILLQPDISAYSKNGSTSLSIKSFLPLTRWEVEKYL
jgi:hypothetical protein